MNAVDRAIFLIDRQPLEMVLDESNAIFPTISALIDREAKRDLPDQKMLCLYCYLFGRMAGVQSERKKKRNKSRRLLERPDGTKPTGQGQNKQTNSRKAGTV